MSEFEFLRSMPFGPYLAVDSPLHRLDPRTRILILFLFLVALTLVPSPVGLGIGLLVALAGWRLANIPYGPLLRGWVAALPFLLFLAVLQVVLRMGDEGAVVLRWGWLVITVPDLLAGLALIIRFSGLMALLGLAAASLSESELTRGLEALFRPLGLLRFPVHDFVMVVQVMLRFFPLLAQVAERIAKAQASRGADWTPSGVNLIRRARQVAPLLVPLFVISLRRAENMAMAMDARGYGSLPVRTSMVVLRFRPADLLALALSAALIIAIFFV